MSGDGRLLVLLAVAGLAVAGAARRRTGSLPGSRGVVRRGRGARTRFPPKDRERWDTIREHAARALFVDGWAYAMKEAERSPRGGSDLMDLAPETNEEAFEIIDDWIEKLEARNMASIDVLYERVEADALEKYHERSWYARPTESDFGHYLVMEALSHTFGVSWSDRHPPHSLGLPGLETMIVDVQGSENRRRGGSRKNRAGDRGQGTGDSRKDRNKNDGSKAIPGPYARAGGLASFNRGAATSGNGSRGVVRRGRVAEDPEEIMARVLRKISLDGEFRPEHLRWAIFRTNVPLGFLTSDGAWLCRSCCRSRVPEIVAEMEEGLRGETGRRQWEVIGVETPDPGLPCEHCGELVDETARSGSRGVVRRRGAKEEPRLFKRWSDSDGIISDTFGVSFDPQDVKDGRLWLQDLQDNVGKVARTWAAAWDEAVRETGINPMVYGVHHVTLDDDETENLEQGGTSATVIYRTEWKHDDPLVWKVIDAAHEALKTIEWREDP